MHSPEEQQRLRESWARTSEYLRSARALLPPKGAGQFEEYLAHNELELALDELEAAGEGRPAEFWRHLLAAAENMGLAEHAARYREHLGE